MKTFYHFHFKKMAAALLLISVFTCGLLAQTPQYYNANSGGIGNSIPFSQPNGYKSQWLIGPGEYSLPSPSPAGNITKLYIYMSTTGSGTYTNVTIKMGQTAITSFPAGEYTGSMTQVYNRPSIALSSTINNYLVFTLDAPFNYNPAQSLVIEISHCGYTGAGMSIWQIAGNTGVFRRNNIPGTTSCVFTYSSQDTRIVQSGIDVSAGGVICNLFANGWCPINTYPVLPAATYFQAAAWIGDTLYVQTPTTAGAGATTVYRYTWNGSWSTGVPCLVAVAGASLTALNGKLYLIGGGASITTGTTNVQIYNPSTGIWTAGAPMPAALSAHGSVNWGDSVIFVVGGPYTGAGTNLNVHYYRPASNTWGTIAGSLPSGQGRRTFALGITNGNKIVMSCGFNTAYLNSTYVGTIGANATSLTWAAGVNAPQALSRPAGVGYGATFFVVGGDTNGTAVKNTKAYCYNVTANTWFNQILNNPNAVSNNMNGVTAKCISDTVRLFQPGGYTTVGTNSFVVTGCGGTFVGVENISGIMPDRYSLSQNYPNPFNPVTNIKFSIPKSGMVKLVIFDILGREVATILNEVKPAGTYRVDYDASSLSSGVYFYTLRSGDFTETKKMVLIK